MPHALCGPTPLISAATQWAVTKNCLAQAPLGWQSLWTPGQVELLSILCTEQSSQAHNVP